MPTRILLRLIFLAGLATPLSAFALGVGPLAVRSALNQNFEADIPLIINNPTELNGLTVQVPRQQEFDRAGIERLALLSTLRFAVETPPGGPNLIKITSVAPIREPNFNLLLEVVWSRGHLIREFTVQVDPELYARRQPPPPPPPLPIVRPVVAAAPAGTSSPSHPPASDLPPAPPVSFEGASTYGPIQRGETLSGVASRVRPSTAISPQQMMAILLAGNPGAFVNGNPSILRAGATLKVPTAQALGVQDAPPSPAVVEAPAAPAFETVEPVATTPSSVATAAPPVPPPSPPPVEASAPVSAQTTPSQPPSFSPVAGGTPATTVATPPAAPSAVETGAVATTVATPPANPPAVPVLAPAEQPREIVPQVPPQPGAAPESATTNAPSLTSPVPAPTATTAVPPPSASTAPPPARPPVQPVVEPEGSWLDNPLVWLALGLIGLAIISVLLLPLLRRSAQSKAGVQPGDQPKAFAEPVTVSTSRTAIEPPTRPYNREESLTQAPVVATDGKQSIRPVRPAEAGAVAAASLATASAAAATTQPRSVTELLKDIDFDMKSVPASNTANAASAPLNLDAPLSLPNVEPVTASATRTPSGRTTETPISGMNLDASSSPTAELPAELRLDGFDFDFPDLRLQQTGSQPVELPPLEMKPGAAGRAAASSPLVIDSEPATEPASKASFVSSLSAKALADRQTVPTTPTESGFSPADHHFNFSDVTQEITKQGEEEISLRLEEKSLPDFGDQPLAFSKKDEKAPPLQLPDAKEAASDYIETKMDLATAYLEMGDQAGARGLLEEVMSEGDASQRQRATELLKRVH